MFLQKKRFFCFYKSQENSLSKVKFIRVSSSKPHISLLYDLPINFKVCNFIQSRIFFKKLKIKIKQTKNTGAYLLSFPLSIFPDDYLNIMSFAFINVQYRK